jgi:dihydrofolate reductase
MRKIIAGMFITLDGVVEAPEKWNPPYYDDELNQAVMPQLAAADTHLYGRRSYQLFRSVFTGPTAPPHAGMMTSTPKIVISATLKDPDWGPTTVISSNITTALTELKQQPGQDITVGASATLVRFLLAEHLLDELMLLVHPVVVGTGKRLFQESSWGLAAWGSRETWSGSWCGWSRAGVAGDRCAARAPGRRRDRFQGGRRGQCCPAGWSVSGVISRVAGGCGWMMPWCCP